MVLFKLLDRSLGLISTLVLTHVLVPADFGLVAMAMSLVALLELFGAFGLDIALIQRANATRTHFDTAWTLNVLIASFVAGALLALAWPLSWFYGEPRLLPLACALALGSAVQGFENIGIVAFRKELDFEREFRFLMTKRLLTFAVSVSLALWLRNYWALAVGIIVSRVSGVVLSYAVHPFRPRLSLATITEFMHFSKWLLVANIFAFLKERSPDFIVGKLAGAHAVGVLSLSLEIANLPGSELIAPINRAAFPRYASLAHDRHALHREFLSVLSLITLVLTPIVTGIALVSPLVVALLLGPKWAEAAMIMKFAAFLGMTYIFLGTSHPLLLAIGKPGVFAKIYALQVAVMVPPMIFFTVRSGVEGAALAYAVTALALLPVNVTLVTRTAELPISSLLPAVWRPFTATTVMYLGTWLAMPSIDAASVAAGTAAWLLGQYVLLGAALYTVTGVALWFLSGRPEGPESSVFRLLGLAWSQIAGRLAPARP
jgi:lipopolysaccharide exporter